MAASRSVNSASNNVPEQLETFNPTHPCSTNTAGSCSFCTDPPGSHAYKANSTGDNSTGQSQYHTLQDSYYHQKPPGNQEPMVKQKTNYKEYMNCGEVQHAEPKHVSSKRLHFITAKETSVAVPTSFVNQKQINCTSSNHAQFPNSNCSFTPEGRVMSLNPPGENYWQDTRGQDTCAQSHTDVGIPRASQSQDNCFRIETFFTETELAARSVSQSMTDQENNSKEHCPGRHPPQNVVCLQDPATAEPKTPLAFLADGHPPQLEACRPTTQLDPHNFHMNSMTRERLNEVDKVAYNNAQCLNNSAMDAVVDDISIVDEFIRFLEGLSAKDKPQDSQLDTEMLTSAQSSSGYSSVPGPLKGHTGFGCYTQDGQTLGAAICEREKTFQDPYESRCNDFFSNTHIAHTEQYRYHTEMDSYTLQTPKDNLGRRPDFRDGNGGYYPLEDNKVNDARGFNENRDYCAFAGQRAALSGFVQFTHSGVLADVQARWLPVAEDYQGPHQDLDSSYHVSTTGDSYCQSAYQGLPTSK